MRIALLWLLLFASAPGALSDAQLARIGRRVWVNECGGTRDGLTSWNAGEGFASLGIGHFIWFPRGVNERFEESFPKLVTFLQENGAALPGWLQPGDPCPWKTRAEFQAEFRGARMNELRTLLADTVPLQSRFLARRVEGALGKMQRAVPGEGAKVAERFQRMAASEAGMFALIDYINFKGEGTNKRERYGDEGWGLLQVLLAMEGGDDPVRDFAGAADRVLTRRVKNSPPERNEAQWLPGWRNRVRAY